MSEADTPSAPAGGSTAGAILRAARERQGIHIAVLAAAIKVSPRKLDALEGDRYDELPDATFTRALAQTVCRALKIEPQPVLALLPPARPAPLDTVADGLNMPFRDRGVATPLSTLLPRAPLIWAALALLVAAGLVLYWPLRPTPAASPQPALPPVLPSASEPARFEPAASEAGSPASVGPAQPAPTTPLPAAATSPASTAPAVPPASAAASAAAVDRAVRPPSLPPAVMPRPTGAAISVSEPVWLEVVDAGGQVVFQRTIQPGENLNFEQKPPLKLKIGNATAARLTYRGEPVDLTPHTRANVARVELK